MNLSNKLTSSDEKNIIKKLGAKLGRLFLRQDATLTLIFRPLQTVLLQKYEHVDQPIEATRAKFDITPLALTIMRSSGFKLVTEERSLGLAIVSPEELSSKSHPRYEQIQAGAKKLSIGFCPAQSVFSILASCSDLHTNRSLYLLMKPIPAPRGGQYIFVINKRDAGEKSVDCVKVDAPKVFFDPHDLFVCATTRK